MFDEITTKMSLCDSNYYDDSSSDEDFDLTEEEDIAMIVMMYKNKKPKHGGSVFGREFQWRERKGAGGPLWRNYFAPTPRYPERYFRRRFRMYTGLFLHICNAVKQHDRSFVQRRNCAGAPGHSTEQKVTAALRMMAYGIPADCIDDNLAMGESTSIFFVKQFAKAVVEVFGLEYLRAPNAQDTARLLEMNKVGFRACLAPLIACTGNERIALQHGMDSTKDATRMQPSFLRQWPIRRHGFGRPTSGCLDLVMISMSCIDLLSSPS